MRISRQIEWDMGHRVTNHKSKCRNLHGHRYKAEICVEGKLVNINGSSDEGMVMDFGDIKELANKYIHDILDHGFMVWVKDKPVAEFFKKNPDQKHIFVPFIPKGEFQGVLYIKKTPDFSNMTNEVVASYDEATIIYLSLIVLGLLAMYYISSYTVKERDAYQQKLLEENEKHITEQIMHDKESLFTKRIYHTHHKAEKIMGFIKEDLRIISESNLEEIKERVKKYSNFISRVIYDMKWYDPPLQTIRNQLFKTNINETIKFLVNHIFLRISSHTEIFSFKLDLDENIPEVHINEFVVWEILEPLIQNSIDHAGIEKIIISISTKFDKESNKTVIKISDNGKGIEKELLNADVNGIKKLFYENITSRPAENQNAGYGCYIAYEIGVKRCGWVIDAFNNEVGCTFEISIQNN